MPLPTSGRVAHTLRQKAARELPKNIKDSGGEDIGGSFLKLFAFMVVYCYRPKARGLNLIDYALSAFSLFVIQSLTGGLDNALVVR